jgi:hypothetical protein
MPSNWKFDYRPSAELPPLAWVARVSGSNVEVDCGISVRTSPAGFFEGTWVGRPGLESVLDSTTPFGTGMMVRDGELYAIPPGTTMALLYSWPSGEDLLVANTLVGLLAKAGLGLLPDFDYSNLFARTADGLLATPTDLPTSGGPVAYYLFENLHVLPGGRIEVSPKPRESPFSSYSDYLARLNEAVRSAFANAPGYKPVMVVPNGYDSPAVATVAARNGCRVALTFRESRPPAFVNDANDSGEHIGRGLGMGVETFDRTAYLSRSDLPEAEFLASGYTGEEVPYVAMEDALRHTMMLTGDLGGWTWLRADTAEPHPNLSRRDFSACSITEFRLRLDYIDMPIPAFGMTQHPSVVAISNSAEMKPWSVGGYYDKPIARRMIEEAGFERGSFAATKRASTALIHQHAAAHLAPATVTSVRDFAAAEGRTIDLTERRRPSRLERGLLRGLRKMRMARLAAPLDARQLRIIQHGGTTGSLLFRWGVAIIRSRYAELAHMEKPSAAD